MQLLFVKRQMLRSGLKTYDLASTRTLVAGDLSQNFKFHSKREWIHAEHKNKTVVIFAQTATVLKERMYKAVLELIITISYRYHKFAVDKEFANPILCIGERIL